jgi:hypothetical protein
MTAHQEGRGMQNSGEELFNFAVDREDVKWLLEQLPPEAGIQLGKVEYELQILKIISVGWLISYHLEHYPVSHRILETYWEAIHAFAHSVSASVGMLTDRPVDYFQVIRERLDQYLKAMDKKPKAMEPASVIGPEFARLCGSENEIHTIACGTRMFVTTSIRVREFFDSLHMSRQ